jgi:hypothetical protein
MRSKIVSIVAVMALALSSVACEVKKTQEGEAPKVEVQGGQLPKYEVKTPSVEVSSTPVQVTVPKVETEKKTVEVPKVNIEPASSTPTPTPHG